ncbi:MAG: ATP-binding protein [Lachnospiraceae bacterium]|nr:ATP-binding protein [Lachnospiraceae bacterium]
MIYNNAAEVLSTLVRAYYKNRDIESILSCVTDNIEWIGTENDDSAHGKEALRKLLETDFSAFPDSFGIKMDSPLVQKLTPDVIVITVTGRQMEVPGVTAGFTVRGTVCCVKTNNSWLIANVHTSVPNSALEKYHLEKELDVNRKKEKALLSGIPGGVAIYRLKKNGIFARDFVSDGLAKICGYDSVNDLLEILDRDAISNVVSEDVPYLRETINKSLRTKQPFSTTYHIYRKDKTSVLIRLDANLIDFDMEPDDVAVFYAVHTLVSDDVIQAKAEQDYYRTILGLTQTTYFELDASGNFYTSDSFKHYKFSDYDPAAIMDIDRAKSCFHPDDYQQVKAYVHRLSTEGDCGHVIARMTLKDASYQWTEITGHVELDSAHKIKRMTGILRNINPEWKKQKAALEAALEEAQNANKAKTNFLSRVSHDMRTPLNGILGLTALLKDNAADEKVLRDLNELEMSGEYLLNLINDTLDVNRIESGKLELHPLVCDGRTLFNNALGLAKISMKEKNIKLTVRAENIPFTLLYVDVSRIEQIIMNVLGNAVKFTPIDGCIDVSIENLSVENGVITDKVMIKDNGIGMSQEFLPHIFDAFAQENSTRTGVTQGTGLGMAIAKQLLRKMGGDIYVTSELGKGSCFTLILKLQIATDEQIAEYKNNQSNVTTDIELSGKRVLLCEDHPLNTQIATRLLETKGMLVEHADNGQAGVDMFQHSAPDYYDAILMDIRMPVMDGIETTKMIRALPRRDAKTVPIIAMTANAFAEDIQQTKEVGMDAHLSKPIQPALLFQTLGETLY